MQFYWLNWLRIILIWIKWNILMEFYWLNSRILWKIISSLHAVIFQLLKDYVIASFFRGYTIFLKMTKERSFLFAGYFFKKFFKARRNTCSLREWTTYDGHLFDHSNCLWEKLVHFKPASIQSFGAKWKETACCDESFPIMMIVVLLSFTVL